MKGVGRVLSLNNQLQDTFRFGTLEEEEYQIVVELNKNELETDTDLYRRINSEYLSGLSYEQRELLDSIYKYKKNYYLIKKNGQKIKLECNNILFTFNFFGDIAINLCGNMGIPFYDNDSTGFFDKNGKKIAFKKDYIVEFIRNEYAIIYNYKNNNYYAYILDNGKSINLNTDKIKFYGDRYIATASDVYILKNNEFKQLNKNSYFTDYKLINMEINSVTTSPYENIIFND